MPHDHASHDHTHDHAHHGHSYANADERRIGIAFLIIFVFLFVELIGGVVSGSLALIADAGHMVSDAVALGLSWGAIRLGKRPASDAFSYGFRRFEILAAFVNGCTLFLIAAWICVEAVRRFSAPVPVLGGTMLIVAIAGLLANVAAFLILQRGNLENLNVRSAWLHVLGDIFGFVVAIVAAIVIMLTGWSPVDPLLSIVVALLILKSAWGIVKSSAHVLLEGTPPGIKLDDIKRHIEGNVAQVVDVHHIHAWSITPGQTLLTLHARLRDDTSIDAVVAQIRQAVLEKFNITHVTVQTERETCPDDGAPPCTTVPG